MTDVDIETYRIGWWTHKWWPTLTLTRCLILGRDPKQREVPRVEYLKVLWSRLRLFRHPHRPWQAEVTSGVRFCRRALTADGARRKAVRDFDWQIWHGTHSPYQRARWLRARRADAKRAADAA